MNKKVMQDLPRRSAHLPGCSTKFSGWTGKTFKLLLTLLCMTGALLALATRANAQNPFVHPLFQTNMVLQRDRLDPVWGWTTPGEVVTVKVDGVTAGTATAGVDGKWVAQVGPYAHDGGQAHTLAISSASQTTVTITNMVFGDVYLASGQSNSNWRLNNVLNSTAEKAAANYPLIREFFPPTYVKASTPSDLPPDGSTWKICTTNNAQVFVAVGYFFARNIHLQTGVPVGILKGAWDGQVIEHFWSPWGLAAIPELSALRQNAPNVSTDSTYSDVYNGMIAPYVLYGLRGVIWYQGEANGGDGNDTYYQKMRALITGWRHEWGQGDFFFYVVQLADYTVDGSYPEVRESQLKILSETNTGLAVTIDAGGDAPNLHPRDKQDVGYRLSLWALANDYGQNMVYSGPLFKAATVEGSQIRVAFDHVGSGLMVGSKASYVNDPALPWATTPVPPVVEVVGGTLQNFEIAGADKVFVPATAVIDGATVVVSAASVTNPVHVRYCYSQNPSGINKLYNAEGLPASPFRTDLRYALVVKNGSGSTGGSNAAFPGEQKTITASAAPSGQVFDRWIGTASGIANVNAASTTVTMPAHAVFLLASYRATGALTYTLTANNAYGSGTSQAGSYLNMEAWPAPAWQVFDKWVGNTGNVTDVYASSTTLTMPSNDITVTATYRLRDSVGDGIPDQWRAANFGGDGTTASALSTATADPDNDGMTNLQEYQAGTDPMDWGSALRITGFAKAESSAAITWSSVAGKTYQVQYCDSLEGPWLETLSSSQLTAVLGQSTLTYTDTTSGTAPKRFYRIRLVVP